MGGRGVRSSAYGGWVKTDRTQFRFRPQPYTEPTTTTSRERGFPERIQLAPPPSSDGSVTDTVGGILGAIAKVPEIGVSLINEPSKAIFGERGVIGAAADFFDPTPIGAGARLLNDAFDTTSRMVGVAGNSYDMMLLRQIRGLPDGYKLPQELDAGADPIGAAVTSLLQVAMTPMTLANINRAVNRQDMTVGQFKALMLQRGMTQEQLQGVMDGTLGQFDPSLGNVRMFDDSGPLGQSLDFATRMAFDPLNIAFGVGGKALRVVGMGMDAARMSNAVKALGVWDESSTAVARATGTALAAGGKTLAEGGTLNPTMKALGHMLAIDKATLKSGVRKAGIGMVGVDAGVVAADAALTPLIGLFGEDDQSGLLHSLKSFTTDVINERPLSESSAFLVLTASALPLHEIGGAYLGAARKTFRDVTGPRLASGLREAIGRDLYNSIDAPVRDAWVTHVARTLAANDLKVTARYQAMFSGGVAETAAARQQLVGMLDRHIDRMVKDRRINAKAIREEIIRQDRVTVGMEDPAFWRRFDAKRASETWTEYHTRAGKVAQVLDSLGLSIGFGTEVWKEQLSLVIDDMALSVGASPDRMVLLDVWDKGGTVGQKVGRLKREQPDLYARIKAEVTPAGKKKSDLSAAIAARVDALTSGTPAQVERAWIDNLLSAYPALREMDIRSPSPDGFSLYRYTRGDSPAYASFDDVYRHLNRLRDIAPTEAELFGKLNEAEAAMGDQARPAPTGADDFRDANDAAGPADAIRSMEDRDPAKRLAYLTARIKELEKEAGTDSSIPADRVREQQAINLEIEAIRSEHPELRPNPKAELAAREIETAIEGVKYARSVSRGFEPEFPDEARSFPASGEPNGFVVFEKEYPASRSSNRPAYSSTNIGMYDSDGKLVGTFSIAHGADQDGFFKISVRDDAQRQGIGSRLLSEAERNGIDLVAVAGKNNYTPSGRALLLSYLRRKADELRNPKAELAAQGASERLSAAAARLREADAAVAAAEAIDSRTKSRNAAWMAPSPKKAKTMKAVSDAYEARNAAYEEWKAAQTEVGGLPTAEAGTPLDAAIAQPEPQAAPYGPGNVNPATGYPDDLPFGGSAYEYTGVSFDSSIDMIDTYDILGNDFTSKESGRFILDESTEMPGNTILYRMGDEGRPVGYVIVKDGVIDSVRVDPALQRTGIATEMYDFLRDNTSLNISEMIGKSGKLTDEGRAFAEAWKKRNGTAPDLGGLVGGPTRYGVARVTDLLAEVPGGEAIKKEVVAGLKMAGKRHDKMTDGRVEEILALLAFDARSGKTVTALDVARAFTEPRPMPLEAQGLHWASDIREQYNLGYISEDAMREASAAQAYLQSTVGDIRGDKYAVRVAPKDRIPVEEIGKSLPESMLKSKLVGEVLYDHPATAWMSSFMESVFHPVRNTEVAQAAKQAWLDQFVGRYGARPDEVARFTSALAEELKSNVANRTGMLMFRGVTAMPAQRINLIAERTLSEQTLAAIRAAGDAPDRILDRGANRFIQKMHERQTSGPAGGDRGRLVRAADNFLPGAIEKTYQAWQASMPGGVARAISKVYYFQLRFLLDPRWWLMNGPEADALAAAQYGIWATRAEGAQKNMPTPASATLDLGRAPKEGELAAREEMYLASDQGSSMYVRHRGGYVTTIVENKVRGNIEREVNAVVPQVLDDLAQLDPLNRALIQRFGANPKSWSNELYDMLYGFDKDGVKPTVDAEVRKLWTEAEVTPEFEAFIDRIAQVNQRTFDDVTHIMSGNMNRSNAERVMNSYWFYWPLSYQLKTGKWLLDVMTKNSIFGPNASGAVRIDQIRQQHVERMQTDESYASIFADNPTLWFTAQMIVPLTPWDIGVSLSRIPRYVGGWLGLWPEYKSAQDPIDAAIQVTKLGPLYTLELARNIRRETFD